MDGSGFGNPERGWNDPPKLAFTGAGPGRQRLLNKRVPIPINPQTNRPNTAPPSLPPTLKASDVPPVKCGVPTPPPPVCPPPTTTTTPPACGAVPPPSSGDADNALPTQDMLQQVQTRLTDSLQDVTEKLKASTHEEIKKRLDVMVNMWQKELLSVEVQKRMMTLTEALSKQDYDKAWALHQSLIVDYTTTCSPWMVGIKTLIAESRGHSDTLPHQHKQGKKIDTEEKGVQDSEEIESSSEK